MTAIALDARQLAEARRVAREIGAAFGTARVAHSDTKHAVAQLAGVHETTLRYFEQGKHPNVKLGNALRFLNFYGLTLSVVPINHMRTHE